MSTQVLNNVCKIISDQGRGSNLHAIGWRQGRGGRRGMAGGVS